MGLFREGWEKGTLFLYLLSADAPPHCATRSPGGAANALARFGRALPCTPRRALGSPDSAADGLRYFLQLAPFSPCHPPTSAFASNVRAHHSPSHPPCRVVVLLAARALSCAGSMSSVLFCGCEGAQGKTLSPDSTSTKYERATCAKTRPTPTLRTWPATAAPCRRAAVRAGVLEPLRRSHAN